jgi:lipoprotein-anchoring transpeptidase ErfK/SrfK
MRSCDLLAIIAVCTAAPAYAQDHIIPDPGDRPDEAVMPDPDEGAEPELTADPEDYRPAAINHARNDDTLNLGPGGFIWTPEVAPAGFVRILVSLSKQRVYVYRGSIRIGVSAASTGRDGYETPTGTFSILQKRVRHRSNRYNNAPMPYMQRLTWDGVALHAGHVSASGFASHGCVRLPYAFAKLLFRVTHLGAVVIVEA